MIVFAEPTFDPLFSTTTPSPVALTLSSADPSIAGNAPVSSPEGILVRPAPEPVN